MSKIVNKINNIKKYNIDDKKIISKKKYRLSKKSRDLLIQIKNREQSQRVDQDTMLLYFGF